MSADGAKLAPTTHRLLFGGRVQGVGLRPFIRRCAEQFGLVGEVRHVGKHVEIRVQGGADKIEQFLQRLQSQAPSPAQPVLLTEETIESPAFDGFSIIDAESGPTHLLELPYDIAACDNCLAEMEQKGNRRFRYPFISCHRCGPRYSVIRALPYQRKNTTMADFSLCPNCQREYENLGSPRFHAEINACPVCGPKLSFSTLKKNYESNETILEAVRLSLRQGNILAIKRTGGYFLVCDAKNHLAVRRLRLKKHRPAKPFVVMFPLQGQDGLDLVRQHVHLDSIQAEALKQDARPAVLCRRHKRSDLARMIAPGLDEIAVSLPNSPLDHLILSDINRPLVMASANLNGEAIIADNEEVENRLFLIADAFLHHNRPIAHPLEDSVVRVIAGRARTLRLGRGLSPKQLSLPFQLSEPVLALGGQNMNTISLAWEDRLVISPHIGNHASSNSMEILEHNIQTLQSMFAIDAKHIVVDGQRHTAGQQWATRSGRTTLPVWHHHAHAAQIAGEHSTELDWLVFTWDATGLGEDGNLWGGDALFGHPGDWKRVASMRPFKLPDGGKANLDPWRSALSLCWETDHVWSQRLENVQSLYKIWKGKIDTPLSTSVGRLFDAAAALLGLCLESSYEGQGGMYLEAACREAVGNALELPIDLDADGIWRTDWSPLLPMLGNQYHLTRNRAANFHSSLARNIVDTAQRIRDEHGDFAVGLSGGVFQNRRLTEESFERLHEAGFRVYHSHDVPCNDEGLSYGQIIEAAHRSGLIRE